MSDDSLSKRATSDRDELGRWRPGCAPGPGNPRVRRLAAAQEAVRAAGTPEAVAEVLEALRLLALKGDTSAATTWLQRVLGRPAEERVGTGVELPADLATPAGVAEALRRTAAAVASGDLGTAEAAAVTATLRAVVDADILARLEERLRAIEGRKP